VRDESKAWESIVDIRLARNRGEMLPRQNRRMDKSVKKAMAQPSEGETALTRSRKRAKAESIIPSPEKGLKQKGKGRKLGNRCVLTHPEALPRPPNPSKREHGGREEASASSNSEE